MNHAKKLQLLAVLGVLTISSASLVQAADIPCCFHWGVPLITLVYKVGHLSLTQIMYILVVKLGRLIAIPIPMQGIQMQRVIILPSGRIALNGSQGGGNVALGAKSFVDGKGDYNFLGNFAAGFKSTISDTIAIGSFAGSGATGNKTYALALAKLVAAQATIRC